MSADAIVFENVSKFYGDVLGVNRVDMSIATGITSLVGPNGSGKSTLMNLMTGLLRPSRGRVSVLGVSPQRPEELNRLVGYCTAFDTFPRGITGYRFVESFLRVHGLTREDADHTARRAIERVGLTEAADRRVAGYSKGMRQRIKLAQAIAHDPKVLVLDEPLNGLDPMVRAEVIALLENLAREGRHIVLSSHILHEVDLISDRVVIMSQGYLVAEGNIQSVRSELVAHPIQVLIRCDRPKLVASRIFQEDHVVEARIIDENGLLVHTRDADGFYLLLNRIVLENDLRVESVAPADEDVQAVYRYLVEGGEGIA